jgi:hypothetical protein
VISESFGHQKSRYCLHKWTAVNSTAYVPNNGQVFISFCLDASTMIRKIKPSIMSYKLCHEILWTEKARSQYKVNIWIQQIDEAVVNRDCKNTFIFISGMVFQECTLSLSYIIRCFATMTSKDCTISGALQSASYTRRPTLVYR